jgi:hypothetical protein
MLKVRSILTFRPVAFLADEGVEQKVSHKWYKRPIDDRGGRCARSPFGSAACSGR